jgi:hypothetical protein
MSDIAEIDRQLLAETPLRPPVAHPKGWEPGFEWDGETGFINTGPLDEQPRTWDEFIKDAGLNPDDVQVVGPVNVRGWDAQQKGGKIVRLHYYKINLIRRVGTGLPDLALLQKQIRQGRRRKPKQPVDGPGRAVVVGFADPQTGKVASRGGTPELLDRWETYRERLGNYIADANAEQGVWCDLGDAVENFENTAAQMGTNDLSIMSQVETATFIEWDGIDLMAKLLPRVVVAGVGSNHCRWRKGKDQLGLPADDWGLHILRQIAKWPRLLAPDAYRHVSVQIPKPHDETMALDVCGQIIGLAHGHQVNRPNQIPDWWTGQSHGGQPIAHADILLTGHFHHLRVEPVGRNPFTDRSRWWFQAPTCDNGSDWFRAIKGYDSDPGLLVFTVTRDGWDNLRILQ